MVNLSVRKVGKSTISWIPLTENNLTHLEILNTWKNNDFIFKEESEDSDKNGLRPPQIGGIYAALGHERSDSSSSATIVMPTGTGKTETILSIIIAGRFDRTLVVVPSDALRTQISKKLLAYELPRKFGLINAATENPKVAIINHGIKEDEELNEIINANVIVASAAALSHFSDEGISKLTKECSHLIVDEAHHVTAVTWARVKKQFKKNKVFQFTATPFRTDGSRIEGKIVYNYPLKKAQEDKYFKPIEFHPVREFIEENADKAIAEKAINLLRNDLSDGLNHIIMARASTIARAREVFTYYEKHSDLNPIIINNTTKKRKKVIEDIKSCKHRVIVCVDMLGEGFDLPQLKISAIHDPHKSINVMLQFTGRFTRNTAGVGDAKFVANIASVDVGESLDELYREDSDWNTLVSNISSRKIQDEKDYEAFKSGFTAPSKLLELGLTPNISTVIYNMQLSNWYPEKILKSGNNNFNIFDSSINDEENLLIFSVKSFTPVGWTDSKELFDESWDLYIAYYNKRRNLLFIHSSAKDGLVTKLVKIIAPNATRIQGERVFRTFHGLKRLKLQNVGLNKNRKGLRYTMHTGTEINEQIPDIEAKRATKSNIFGKGYEDGVLVTIGGSYKGKVWSMDSDSIEKWILWCDKLAVKILDNSIDTNTVLTTAMRMDEIDKLPDLEIITVEWPNEILRKNEQKTIINSEKWEESLLYCELLLSNPQPLDKKSFTLDLKAKDETTSITGTFTAKGEVRFDSSEVLNIKFGEQSLLLTDFLNEYPPILFLEDTSFIDGGLRVLPHEDYEYLYSIDNVEDWKWTGVDISVESQTPVRLPQSIQYYTIKQISQDYDFIFDDDGSGEVADIVAIKNINDIELVIHLYHCKYCSKSGGVAKPGARVDDIYQVVGQAVKSIRWFSNKEQLILRLMEREKGRLAKGLPSRIDKGKYEDLVHFARVARYSTFKLGISVVQPAVSKKVMTREQLIILGATEAYIDDVTGVKLRVIVNE
ncbi:DEAD/DEAH box helicase [Pectobacterium brasiliense]|uniref:DEAD/DEAH box helicase n=1 Tax=Pectobacterium brasiliense TaxID=180957 RepID=UPI002A82BAEE|nr:DEAD/DEAH box helicase family protein [Pectobacterium brasiliense]MDY4347440.1 DEAD/DEAH box helicase family protein [Pectobacterium brasiliense]